MDRIVVAGGGESDAAQNCTMTWVTFASSAAGEPEASGPAKTLALQNMEKVMGLGEATTVRMFQGGGSPNGNRVERDVVHAGEMCEVLDPDTNTWSKGTWDELCDGDVVRVEKMGYFPADLLLLGASSPSEVCVQTACFDGDMSLRHWQVENPHPHRCSMHPTSLLERRVRSKGVSDQKACQIERRVRETLRVPLDFYILGDRDLPHMPYALNFALGGGSWQVTQGKLRAPGRRKPTVSHICLHSAASRISSAVCAPH